MDAGLWGGIIGAAVGTLGGIIGTVAGIRSATTPAARSFMIRCSVWMWVAVVTFVVLLMVLPQPYNWLLWIPYAPALPLSIRFINRRLGELQPRN